MSLINKTFAFLWTQLHTHKISHFLSPLIVLKKELENVTQCRRLIKPRTTKAMPQESQFCRELKVTLSQPYSGLEMKDK